MTARTALIVRLRERLESLWDCTCTPAVECERCSTLREIDDVLLAPPPA